MLRENPMIAGLAAGQVQIGTWINLIRNPAVLVLLKSAGLDYARLDMEHSSPSIETVADMAVLSRALDFPLVVRPPAGNREWITRLLDVGVWGLHIPQVDTPEIARQVAQATRYAPQGDRGMNAFSPGHDFALTPAAVERMTHLNTQVHVTVMLESAAAFEQLDEIVATPGIDAYTLGPTDLAQDLGRVRHAAPERSPGRPPAAPDRRGAAAPQARRHVARDGRGGRAVDRRRRPHHRLLVRRGHAARGLRQRRRAA